MNYKSLTPATWNQVNLSGNKVSGYEAMILESDNTDNSVLHIFKDELGCFHFAIQSTSQTKIELVDPGINGLSLQKAQFRIENNVHTYIDLKCELSAYIKEFTEIVKVIAQKIFTSSEEPERIVQLVINNWKSFWSSRSLKILTEDEIIGLFCELKVLYRLIQINPHRALNSWKGPLKERHDFVFSEWSFEVKGTRTLPVTHTINGLDQLLPSDHKHLALISYLVSLTESIHSKSLPDLVLEITTALDNHGDLVILFNNLLARGGYNRFDEEEYREVKIDVLRNIFFVVDDNFPCLTTSHLSNPLDARISDVRYSVSVEGLNGESCDNINFGNFFY